MNQTLKLAMVAFAAGMCGGILGAMLMGKPAQQTISQNAPSVSRTVAADSSKTESVTPSLAKGGVVPAVLKDCTKELYQFCAQIEPGKGALKNCLLANESGLSASCSKAARMVKPVQLF